MKRAPSPRLALGLSVGALVLALAPATSSCQDRDPACNREPAGSLTAYILPAPPAMHFAGTVRVLSVGAVGEDGMQRAVVRDTAAAGLDTLVYGAPAAAGVAPLPLSEGELVGLVVDYVGGFPSASGILITDGSGVRLAGASEQRPGMTVLTGGIPGWTVEMLPATCDSRLQNDCYDSVTNAPLRLASGGDSVTLYQGESADLGVWRARCLTSQVVSYNSRCTDAGLVGVSYVIARRDSASAGN